MQADRQSPQRHPDSHHAGDPNGSRPEAGRQSGGRWDEPPQDVPTCEAPDHRHSPGSSSATVSPRRYADPRGDSEPWGGGGLGGEPLRAAWRGGSIEPRRSPEHRRGSEPRHSPEPRHGPEPRRGGPPAPPRRYADPRGGSEPWAEPSEGPAGRGVAVLDTPSSADPPATLRTRRSGGRARRRDKRAARRTVVGRHPLLAGSCAVLVLLTPVWVSLGKALTNPGLGSSVAARGAEWFRGHGGSSIVNWAENLWYSHHAPPVGGTPAQLGDPAAGVVRPAGRQCARRHRPPHATRRG